MQVVKIICGKATKSFAITLIIWTYLALCQISLFGVYLLKSFDKITYW